MNIYGNFIPTLVNIYCYFRELFEEEVLWIVTLEFIFMSSYNIFENILPPICLEKLFLFL